MYVCENRSNALYGRQSVDKKDSISIESQLIACEYESRGEPFLTYKDKGYSGKNLNRPDFERLMEDIKQGLIKKVIVYKLDRISRSILDFANLMQFFEKYNVEFVSTTEKFDTSTPVGRAMLNICIVFAQLERETIQERVFNAYHSRSKKGFYMGGRLPYGFDKEPTVIDGIHTSKLVPNKEQSEEIKLIFSLYATGKYSLGDIVRYLKERKIEKKVGKAWATSRISEVLRNPIYVKSDLSIYNFFKGQGVNIENEPEDFIGNGCYLYQGTVSKSNKQYDLKDKVLVVAPHEGFISSETWLKCRMKCLTNRQSATTCKGSNSWLTGKIKCGNCNYAVIIRKANTKWGRYFVCSGREHYKNCIGTGATIYADVIEEYIFNEIKKKLSMFTSLSSNTTEKNNPELQKIELELAHIDKEINDLLDKVSNANEILFEYINNRISLLDNKRKELAKKTLEINHANQKQDFEEINNHIQNWEKATFEEKKMIVDALIKVIYVKGDEINIEWYI